MAKIGLEFQPTQQLAVIVILYIVTDEEVTIENYFPEVGIGNIPRGRRARGI